jgi:hypothetical protein
MVGGEVLQELFGDDAITIDILSIQQRRKDERRHCIDDFLSCGLSDTVRSKVLAFQPSHVHRVCFGSVHERRIILV